MIGLLDGEWSLILFFLEMMWRTFGNWKQCTHAYAWAHCFASPLALFLRGTFVGAGFRLADCRFAGLVLFRGFLGVAVHFIGGLPVLTAGGFGLSHDYLL